MKCEEFEEIGLDGGRDACLSEAERAAIAEHVKACTRCAALQSSWQQARRELHALAEETVAAQTPARVEMRLRQEFRTRHSTWKGRRTAVAAAWALAAAAVLVVVMSWARWRDSRVAKGNPSNGRSVAAPKMTPADFNAGDDSVTLVANNQSTNFTLLPGVQPSDIDDAEILRVRMQRGALGALGLPVNEDSANEWIQVELLVGDDGSPQAVHLLQQE